MSFCSTLPGCNTAIAPATINSLIVPTFMQGLTAAEQAAYVNATTQAAQTFRTQALQFYAAGFKANQQLGKRLTTCPFSIPWAVSTPPIVLNQQSMSGYYSYFVTGSVNTGFAYILRLVITYFKQQARCETIRKNGGSGCC